MGWGGGGSTILAHTHPKQRTSPPRSLVPHGRYGGYGTSPSPSPGPSPTASDGQLQLQLQRLREEHVDELARQRRKADDDLRRVRANHEEEVRWRAGAGARLTQVTAGWVARA